MQLLSEEHAHDGRRPAAPVFARQWLVADSLRAVCDHRRGSGLDRTAPSTTAEPAGARRAAARPACVSRKRAISSKPSRKTGRASSCRWPRSCCSPCSSFRAARPNRRTRTSPTRSTTTPYCSGPPGRTGPVRRGGLASAALLVFAELCFMSLFVASLLVHAIKGAEDTTRSDRHGEPEVTAMHYVTGSRFWFESFQNWQSEFLSLAAMVYLSVYLPAGLSGVEARRHARTTQTGNEVAARASVSGICRERRLTPSGCSPTRAIPTDSTATFARLAQLRRRAERRRSTRSEPAVRLPRARLRVRSLDNDERRSICARAIFGCDVNAQHIDGAQRSRARSRSATCNSLARRSRSSRRAICRPSTSSHCTAYTAGSMRTRAARSGDSSLSASSPAASST